MKGGGAGTKQQDPDLQQQCDELGIVLFRDHIAPVRVPRRTRDGRLILDFASDADRRRFKEVCVSKVASNCQEGARAACCLRGMDHCRGPSWLRQLGWKHRKTWAEVEQCEEEYLEACLATSTKACQEHAERFCCEVVASREPGSSSGGA